MIVNGTHLDLVTPAGPMRTYVYTPEPPRDGRRKFPGLILYSEIFQQTEPIRRLALQFASQGHVVLVPEATFSGAIAALLKNEVGLAL